MKVAPMWEESTPTADHLEHRLGFETMLADLSSRFINLPPGEVDREIEEALGRVCGAVGIDLAVLWQWLPASPETATATHLYFQGGGPRPDLTLRQDQYPWVAEQMMLGRTVIVRTMDDLPDIDRASARHLGIKASVCLPLVVGGEPPVGILALSILREERDWPDPLVSRLRLVGQVFTNALARERADAALREREEINRATFDLAAVGIAHVGIDGRWLRVNDRMCALLGFRREELLGMTFQDVTHRDDLAADLEYVQQLLSGRIPSYSMEKRYVRKDGSLLWGNLTVSLVRKPTGAPNHFIAVVEDITESKQREEALKDLSRRLIRAHEEERALLARELHDDLTQRLAVLAIDVGSAELAAPDGPNAGTLRAVREGLVRLSEDVHTLAYQLHPSVLEELGLLEALRTECERITRQGRVDVSARLAPLPEFVGREEALCIFRVAQEALNNVMRHAGARAATVDLRPMDGGLLLAVRDDGGGFDPAGTGGRRSLGLASMRERVHLVNGTVDVESAPGAGTSIVAWVPVKGPTR